MRVADAFWVMWSERVFEPFVSLQRNALTGKAWEDAVQGLSNIRLERKKWFCIEKKRTNKQTNKNNKSIIHPRFIALK